MLLLFRRPGSKKTKTRVADSSRLPVQPGEIFAGKYRVERIIGSGAMGVVVAAHHVQLDDEVAIKFMLPEAIGNAQAVERFSREARAAVKIKSEHVVRVHDVGILENGTPYMVMEYLRGKDLAEWLTERGTVQIEQAVDFLLQASEAIAEAHSLGIVHRDLKPANLFVIQRGDGAHVKVLDFGISKLTGKKTTGSEMTQTSVVMGSPFYMSPEQLRSTRDVDLRSDIWALGCILYELLAGGPPFEGDTMPELVHRTVSEPPLPLRDVRPDAPEALEQVILKCLEKDPAARFQNVADLALALVPFGLQRSHLSLERISGYARLNAATMPSSPALSPQAPGVSGRPRSSPVRSSSPVAFNSPSPTPATQPSAPSGVKAETASWTHTQHRSKRRAVSLAVAGVALVAVAWFAFHGAVEPSVDAAQPNPPPVSPGVLVAPPPHETDLAAPRAEPVATVVAEPEPSATAPAGKAEDQPATPGKRPKRPASPSLAVSVAPAAVAPSAAPPAAPAVPKKPKFSDLIDDRK
jgi:serine/threonine-protein kinase